MKKRILSFAVLICILMPCISFLCVVNSEEKDNFTVIHIPYKIDYSVHKYIKARYADTKEPITLSATYNDRLYAYVPLENAKREIEAYEAEAMEFTDYEISSYKFYVFKLLSMTNLIMGNELGEAQPNANITRAEATALVIRLLGLKAEENTLIPFTDVNKDDWYYGVILTSYKHGMVLGKTETTFAPNDNITREEITVILKRAMDYAKLGFPGNDNLIASDYDQISDWAKEAYAKFGNCTSTDVDNTDPDNPKRKIAPQKNATRYDVAYMIDNIRTHCVIYPSQIAEEYGFDKQMPVIDGSTSTYPFTEAVYSSLFYNGYVHPQKPQKHSKSHESYKRLIDGEIDMMFASVYPASDILEYAKEKNVELELIPIAYDAMIFFTNKDNSCEGLTKEQISNIYVNNAYSNWNEIGGSDALLYPYCRNNDSGSHAQMEKHFLGGSEIHEKIREETTSVTMANVLTDVMDSETTSPEGFGLGYSIYYYFNNMDLFYNTKSELKLLAIDGVHPTDETIANGTYPLSNNTYVVLRKDTPKDSPARKMAEFMLTEKGQECVETAGFGKLKKISETKTFTDKLLSQINSGENFVLSPFSIKTALSMAANGADRSTKEEILNALNVTSEEELNNLSKETANKFLQTENLKFSVANSVWINKDKTAQDFSQSYIDIIKEYYNGDVNKTNDKNAVSDINSWVNDKTQGKIPQIINNSDFWATLVNAVYFKGLWKDDFYDYLTKKDDFLNYDKTVSQVDFMKKRDWTPYVKTDDFEVIEMSFQNRFDNFSEDGEYISSDHYKDLNLSMFFIMTDNVSDIEKELNSLIENESFKNTYIDLALPKFKVEYEMNLNETLKNIGINKAFSLDAEFEKMFDKGSMFISDAIHKTYLSIDEKGCEAAAVTALGMAGSSLPPEPVNVKFNKPFYFVLRDNLTKETLFIGKINTL